jgi:tetratricopeptide (TPR) repeat protein
MPSRRARQTAGALLLALGVSACSLAPQTRALRESPPPDLAPSSELVRVPFFPQEDYQCGPAALATVLQHRGIGVTDQELVSEVYIPARRGSLQAEIVAAARRRGMLVMPIEPRLDALLSEIAAGNPVLVLQNLGLDWMPAWHYAVVVGYDLDTRELVLRSGTIERRATALTSFERTWARSSYWGIVVAPPDSVPVTARPLPYLEAANALEQIGQTIAARRAYLSAHRRWPDNAIALIGLGNTEYVLGDASASSLAFRRATELDPDSVQAWNNLGYALAASGCPAAARAAAACALRLAPDDPDVRDTWNELNREGEDGPGCERVRCPGASTDRTQSPYELSVSTPSSRS